jgi:hypothetical protein
MVSVLGSAVAGSRPDRLTVGWVGGAILGFCFFFSRGGGEEKRSCAPRPSLFTRPTLAASASITKEN